MSDFSSILVVRFSGKKEQWPIWSEKFCAVGKRSGFKDMINEKGEERKILMKITDLNRLAYKELVLLIGIRSSNRRVLFSIITG
jgi:hypothetical protein